MNFTLFKKSLFSNRILVLSVLYWSYLVFGTFIEATLMGKQVNHYREDELYKGYSEVYPLYNAREGKEFC